MSVETRLTEVWRRNRELMTARAAAIELAASDLDRRRPRASRLEAGREEAHKLAGVLGTFGLSHGSELARDLETHLTSPQARKEAARLKAVAAELRATVERPLP